jgi:hypothetical protein
MGRRLQIGLIQVFTVTYGAIFITLGGRLMMTFGVWRRNDAKGGMRFAFPPCGPVPRALGDLSGTKTGGGLYQAFFIIILWHCRMGCHDNHI